MKDQNLLGSTVVLLSWKLSHNLYVTEVAGKSD